MTSRSPSSVSRLNEPGVRSNCRHCWSITSLAGVHRAAGAAPCGRSAGRPPRPARGREAPSSCAPPTQLQSTGSSGSNSVFGAAYRRTLRGTQRQCQRPGAASTCRCRGTRLSRDGSAVITMTIGSPGSMRRRQAMHANSDILRVAEQHARQTGGATETGAVRGARPPSRATAWIGYNGMVGRWGPACRWRRPRMAAIVMIVLVLAFAGCGTKTATMLQPRPAPAVTCIQSAAAAWYCQ